uniref:Putative secreted protein n=1 Tax=Anopheles darlingi TaxID=43151 RepID=A0A2M4D3F3_ANODA
MESSDPFRVALLATCSVVVAVRAYLNPGSGLWSLLQGKVNFKASFWQARAPSPTPKAHSNRSRFGGIFGPGEMRPNFPVIYMIRP